MEVKTGLFNENKLRIAIDKFKAQDIPNLNQKLKIIKNYKKAISNGDLSKTIELKMQKQFITAFFSDILGYKWKYNLDMSVNDEWNIEMEEKTLLDSTKPDGTFGYFTKNEKDVRFVLELKDATTELDAKQRKRGVSITPVEQGFLYALKNGSNCKWIIVSNFKEIRLYHCSRIDEYQKFTVTKLDDIEEFKKFYYLLNVNNLINKEGDSLVDNLYKESKVKQNDITRKFYLCYKNIRIQMFNLIAENNKNVDRLVIIEKVQKLLDRFIFIFFCEANNLLPPNTFIDVIESASKSKSRSKTKMWNAFKDLFDSIDKGNTAININKFNGGLFKDDDILNSLIIPNKVFMLIKKISPLEYDYKSELDVNILGHIFEQSITDIEQLKSEYIDNADNEKDSNKRKENGIYYTPKIITRYIVKETIGKWLEEKKKELGFDKLKPVPDNIKRLTKEMKLNIKKHIELWGKYKNVLYNIKVLDPACGSGAFLSEAFEYLYKEGQRVNRTINNLKGKLTKTFVHERQMFMFELDKHILKNNLYGVDINNESVEITKLSLWIKTANKKSQLTFLDDNIKCGNSLILDKKFANNKAFDWKKEFKEIMKNGGFDIIIGNPPYIEWYKIRDREYFHKGEYLGVKYDFRPNHKDSQPNIYIFFLILSKYLLKNKGKFGFITSQEWLNYEKLGSVKKDLIKDGSVKLINFDSRYSVFVDIDGTNIGTNSSIIIYNKDKTNKVYSINIPLGEEKHFLQFDLCSNTFYEIKGLDKWNLKNYDGEFVYMIDKKIKKFDSISLSNDRYFDVFGGFQPPVKKIPLYSLNKSEYFKVPKKERNLLYKAIVESSELDRYKVCDGFNYWIIANDLKEEEFKKGYPYLYELLNKRIEDKDDDWYKFPNIRNIDKFKNYKPKIITPRTKKYNAFSYDNDNHVFKGTNSAIYVKDYFDIKYVLGYLNSTLYTYWYNLMGKDYHGLSRKYEPSYLKKYVSIPKLNKDIQEKIAESVDIILESKNKINNLVNEFNEWVKVVTNRAIRFDKFYNYDFKEYIKLNKFNISPRGLAQLKKYFIQYKQLYEELNKKIYIQDKNIDYILFKEFNLNDMEIKNILNYTKQLKTECK